VSLGLRKNNVENKVRIIKLPVAIGITSNIVVVGHKIAFVPVQLITKTYKKI